jgi:hypothetical protein
VTIRFLKLFFVYLFKVCLFVTFWICVLLRLVFESLYAMSVKVYCLFFFQGLLVVVILGLLSTIYLFWRPTISWLLVCLFVFEGTCIIYVYYLLVCLYLSLKVCCLYIYLFTSFRVIGCVCLWMLVRVFVFEGLNEGVSLWGKLDQAFDFWSMLDEKTWNNLNKKTYLTKQTIILIHVRWLDIRMNSYNRV